MRKPALKQPDISLDPHSRRIEAEIKKLEESDRSLTSIVGRMREVAYCLRTGNLVHLPLSHAADPKDLDTSEYLAIYADAIQLAKTNLLREISSSLRLSADHIKDNLYGLKDMLNDLADHIEDLPQGTLSPILSNTIKYLTSEPAQFTRKQVDNLLKEEYKRGFNTGWKAAFREE